MRCSRRTPSILTVLAIMLLVYAAAAAQPSQWTARLDRMFQAAYPADEPGAAVAVVKDGQIVLRKGYGMADLELGVPVEPDMVFRIGSVTKQFTAAAIMLLVRDGKLAVEDEITKYLPAYPTHDRKITLHHLLTHTSGIPSYTDEDEVMSDLARDRTVEEVIATFKDKDLLFEPGEQWRYSNSNYFLLGAVIEAVTGIDYEEFMRIRVFEPLGLQHTLYGNHERIVPRRARGYQGQKDDYANAPYISMTVPYAAGALLSTVDDLTRWNRALAAAELLPSDLVERMWAANRLNNGDDSNYGYGWMIRDYNGKRVVQHGGGIHGFVSFLLFFPDDDLSVAVLSNNPGNESNPQMLAQKAAATVMGESLDWVAIDLEPAVLERYVGVYRIDEDEDRVVTLEDGQLFTQRTGGALNKAYPHSQTGFFYKHSLSHFWFVVDESGEVTHMVMKPWGGKEEKALRTDKPIPEGPQAVEIDPEIYDDYEGAYELMPGFVLTVTREGDELIGQATGQDSFVMLPQSETEFFIREASATITFHRDAETGKVTDLLLSQGGMELTGKRVD